MSDIRYDRRVDPSFLDLFTGDGVFASLPFYAREAAYPIDLQLRRLPGKGAQHATLYVGLTSVLDVRFGRGGRVRLDVHPSHEERAGFDASWRKPRDPEEWAALIPAVEDYLDRVIPLATRSHGSKEGAVQAAVSRRFAGDRVFLDREVSPSYRDRSVKEQCIARYRRMLAASLDDPRIDWTTKTPRLGTECDALGVDGIGRVLAVEVKPAGVSSVAFVAAQAAMYALMFKDWLDQDHVDGEEPGEVLRGLLDQRQSLGLAPEVAWTIGRPTTVVPVVAVQRGSSPEIVRRMRTVRDVVNDAQLGIAPVEIYEVDVRGRLLALEETRAADGRPVPSRAYVSAANAKAIAWKRNSEALSDGARSPGAVGSRSGTSVLVDYALPREHARENLLPEVRERVLEIFSSDGIAWHQGIDGGPTNHLRSSQVQCVNALGQMVDDPARIKAAFGGALDIDEIRDLGEVSQAERSRFLAFEFTGEQDYFGEANGGRLQRGARNTSVDAAFAYTTHGGHAELALVEWKFTETYPAPGAASASRESTRLKRYQDVLVDPDGPIKADLVSLPDLFHEPIYQLVRQQLLAWRLETDAAIRADRVRVLHVLSRDNVGYGRSYLAPTARALGVDVHEAWHALLRRPDRFVSVDPSVFLDPAITSAEYVARYSVTAPSRPLTSGRPHVPVATVNSIGETAAIHESKTP